MSSLTFDQAAAMKIYRCPSCRRRLYRRVRELEPTRPFCAADVLPFDDQVPNPADGMAFECPFCKYNWFHDPMNFRGPVPA
jgi:hypothetical protein